jgi:hypothetical protein
VLLGCNCSCCSSFFFLVILGRGASLFIPTLAKVLICRVAEVASLHTSHAMGTRKLFRAMVICFITYRNFILS